MAIFIDIFKFAFRYLISTDSSWKMTGFTSKGFYQYVLDFMEPK